MTTSDCHRCGKKTSAGNCPQPLAEDGHVVQCVGEWVDKEKHEYLRRYIDATRKVRRKFSGSGYLDLFAGPGRVRLRETGEVCDGSPLIALSHTAVAFRKVVLCDLASENVEALRARTAKFCTAADPDRVTILHGDSNDKISELIACVPRGGLNLALIDPFGLRPLRFETLRRLANEPHMDLMVNFPTSDIRRNQGLYRTPGDQRIALLLDDERWRETLEPRDLALQILDRLLHRLETFGYTGAKNRMVTIKNSQGGELYRIVFAAKHRIADKIWRSITMHTASGQRSLGPGFE